MLYKYYLLLCILYSIKIKVYISKVILLNSTLITLLYEAVNITIIV